MNDRQESQSFKSLPRPQKVAVISLSIVALGIIVIWFWQFNSRINAPFTLSPEELAAGKKMEAEKAAKIEAEKTKDTDKDGLLDIDELNIYKTSPYLEDTDGDNITDFDEIRAGKDPLCPEGSSCGLIDNNLEEGGYIASSTEADTPAEKVDQTLLIKALSGQGDAGTMRQILLQAGASEEQLNLISDEDLMSIYKDILASQNPEAVISEENNN
jgi:hypothetical protein